MPHVVILRRDRSYAHRLVDSAPDGFRMTIDEPKRTNEQNDKMWAMLTDVCRAEPQGFKRTPDDWKCMFMNALGHECQFVLGLDGRPFPVGFRSSRLTKAQMSDLIEFMYEYGARHDVKWKEP